MNLPLPRMIFHLSICLSNTAVQEKAAEFLSKEAEKQQQAEAQRQERATTARKQPPTKGLYALRMDAV